MGKRKFAVLTWACVLLAVAVVRGQSPDETSGRNAPGVLLHASDGDPNDRGQPASVHVADEIDDRDDFNAYHADRRQNSVLVPVPTPSPQPKPAGQSALDPPAATDARLTDEEIALIRRWTRGLARQEDRHIFGAKFAQPDPFADDPTALSDEAVRSNDDAPRPFGAFGGVEPEISGQHENENNGQMDGAAANSAQSPRGFDPAVVAAGQSAFQSSCTACHDAERSTTARKSLGGWMATVRRMTAKEGADVAPGDVQPIATYLASLNPAASNEAGGDGAAVAESSWSVFSTVSLSHRSGVRDEIENQGFFPEVWLGAEWHPAGPLSARVNVCVSCHTENPSISNRVELAEGFFRLDVMRLMGCEDPACQPFQLHVDAGRFIVPFGAFAAQSHPGAYRTATRPLMYNMGQNVYRDELPAPLLPMPYADEGVMASATLPLFAEVNATFDFYAVNGLQGSTGIDLSSWYQSRDYVDNNSEPAVGGRATIGNKYLRAGASLMSGRYNENSLTPAVPETLDYKIYGADLVARYEDWVRIQVEWARRDNDAFDFLASEVGRESIKGTIVEGEFKLWKKPKISAVVRYDDQRRTDGPMMFGTPILTPDVSVQRFTYGLNMALGSSTLMVNHERWKVPAPLNDVDVLAIRWVAAF